MEDTKKIAMAVGAVVVGGALLWYLSNDADQIKYDKKVHTPEKMKMLLDELKLEYSCIYVRHYNLILRMKEQNQFQKDTMPSLEAQLNYEKDEKYKQVVSRFDKFSTAIVNQWCKDNASDPHVKAQVEDLNRIHEQVYTHCKIVDMGYTDKLPKVENGDKVSMTREMYIQIYRKIFAALRHDYYKELKQFMQENKVHTFKEIPQNKFDEIWGKVWATFEKVREDIYNMMMDSQVEQPVAKRIMQMAYISYASVGSAPMVQTEKVERSRWADQVTEAANHHARLLDKMKQGELYDHIEIDPRDSKEADEKMSLAGAVNRDQALNQQKTFLADKAAHSEPVPPKATKFVNKFVEQAKEKAKQRKEAEEAKAREEAANAEKKEETKVEQPVAESKKEEPVAEVKAEETAKVAELAAEPVKEDVKPAEPVQKDEVKPVEEPKAAEAKVEEPKVVEAPKPAEPKTEESKNEVPTETVKPIVEQPAAQ